jgi:hypothetical protein
VLCIVTAITRASTKAVRRFVAASATFKTN